MNKRFARDEIKHENKDANELSSSRYLIVPLMMLSAFFSFGITYLVLMTPNMELSDGDSRRHSSVSDKVMASSEKSAVTSKLLSGETLYASKCQACHQTNGRGVPGAFPPLADSRWVTGSEKRLIMMVLHGLHGKITVDEKQFNGVMPAFKDNSTNEEIAAILSYIRSSWTNKASKISPESVKSVREATRERTSAWNGEAELNTIDETKLN